MSPLVIELDPLRAAGPVLLGASFEETGRAPAAWGAPRPYAPYPGEDTVHFRDLATGRPAADPITASGIGALTATTTDGRPVVITVMADTTVQVWDVAARLQT